MITHVVLVQKLIRLHKNVATVAAVTNNKQLNKT